MTTKSSRHASASASASDAQASLLAPLNMLSDVTRQQLTMMTEATCAVLGSSEALGKIQQQAAHQASLRHNAAAESLRGEVEPMDIISIETELVRQDMQEVAQYWAQLASAVMRTQLDMMGRMTHMLNSTSQGGLGSAMDAWRSAVSASTEGIRSRADVH
jgi:aspartate aminotransferase-like enzyme